METRNEAVDVIVEHLKESAQPSWARWALDRAEQRWQLRFAEIFVGAEPPGFATRRWEYSEHLFVERPAAIHQITAALTGDNVRLGRITAIGAPLLTNATRNRQQSYADFGGHRLPWPTIRYEVNRIQTATASGGADPLISQTSPSFPYHDAAFMAFFRPSEDVRWQQNAGTVVVVTDTGARLAGLAIRPGEVIVTVAGESLIGCIVQASCAGQFENRPVDGPGTLSFPLPEPFVHELLIVLADDDGWRDLRLINPPGMPNAADPSIVWDDPQIQLEALLAGGEGPSVEFKEKLPSKSSDSLRTALKAVPAFANSGGGVLIFGVDDSGAPVGLTEDPEAGIARLTDLIHGHVHPVPRFSVQLDDLGGKQIIVVEVQPGSEKPYALFREPPQIYARHGATSFHATREEIVAWSAGPDGHRSLWH